MCVFAGCAGAGLLTPFCLCLCSHVDTKELCGRCWLFWDQDGGAGMGLEEKVLRQGRLGLAQVGGAGPVIPDLCLSFPRLLCGPHG